MLASESWLVLLVRMGGSELVTDSVSLFWSHKVKRQKETHLVLLKSGSLCLFALFGYIGDVGPYMATALPYRVKKNR